MSDRYLAHIVIEIRRELAIASMLDVRQVEMDIAARRREANVGKRWALQRGRIQKELSKLGTSENDWIKQALGSSLTTMRLYRQLARDWPSYETARRAAGATGQSGLRYGLSLIADKSATNSRSAGVGLRLEMTGTLDTSRCTFITGDALIELRKLPPKSVNVVCTSPPYWPLKRAYGGKGIGYEDTATEYIANVVAIFREARRVLTDGGVLWVVIGDSYSSFGGRYSVESYFETQVNPQMARMPVGQRLQKGDRPPGSLLLIPARLALAMQDDGWILRQEIIWDKGFARPESVQNRVTRTHETAFMFTKQAREYFYDQDAVRVPMVRPYSIVGKQKPGVVRRDLNRDYRVLNNPMGRNAGSVWRSNAVRYPGGHTAPLPIELVRWMLLASCDDNAVVCDPFGGAGSVALVALQLGYRAITIDLYKKYTQEAIERLRRAPETLPTVVPLAAA